MTDEAYYRQELEGHEAFACLLEGIADAVRGGASTRVVVVYDDGTGAHPGEVSCHLGDGTPLDAVDMCSEAQLALIDLMREYENEVDNGE